MTLNQAQRKLPPNAMWHCSFGYPGQDGYCEVWRDIFPTGKRYEIRRADHYDDEGWTFTESTTN